MNFFDSNTYTDDINTAIQSTVNFSNIFDSSILVTGASGLIGSYIVDMLYHANENGANITIYITGRNKQRLQDRFPYGKTDKLIILEHDVNIVPEFDFKVDYIIHAASNAYPAIFQADPVGTLMSNILGTKHLLDYGVKHNSKRLLYISSGEVYGQGDLSLDSFEEAYGGYIDPTSARSSYPNGKRAAETLCVSYSKQFGLDTVIARPSHTYGPNTTLTDNRANVQFVNKGIAGEDIVLNSAGNQMRSYTYISDAVSAILTILINGHSCEAYNVANKFSRTTIAGYAREVAKQSNTSVIFTDPDEVAKLERSPIAKQVLNSDKIESLGWKGKFDIEQGITRTLTILQELK